MGIAALVLGIISLLLSLIPLIGLLGIGLAIIGLILGIIDWVQKKKKDEKYGYALAGVICAGVSIIIVMFYSVLFGVLFVNFASNFDTKHVEEFVDNIKNMDDENIQSFFNPFQEMNVNEYENETINLENETIELENEVVIEELN